MRLVVALSRSAYRKQTTDIASTIKRRKFLGVDQASVAELAEISTHTLSSIESGNRNPTLKSLNRVLDVLGLELVIQAKANTSE